MEGSGINSYTTIAFRNKWLHQDTYFSELKIYVTPFWTLNVKLIFVLVLGLALFFKIHNRFFKRFYLFIFRERGREERKGKKHQCVVASHAPQTGDLARNPGMCPHWELNQ